MTILTVVPTLISFFLDLDLLYLDFDLLWFEFLSLGLPLDSVFKAKLDVSSNFLQCISLLRIRSQTSLNTIFLLLKELLITVTIAFQISGRENRKIRTQTSSPNLISTELSCIVIILNLFMWATTYAPSIIHQLNNRFIKCTLFKANGFLYMLERIAIRPVMVLSFVILKATLQDNVNGITPNTYLSSKAHSSSSYLLVFLLKEANTCLSDKSSICIFYNLKSSPLKFSILMLFPSSDAITPSQI